MSTDLEKRIEELAQYRAVDRNMVVENTEPYAKEQYYILYGYERDEGQWPPRMLGIWSRNQLKKTLAYWKETGLLRYPRSPVPRPNPETGEWTFDYGYLDPAWIQVVRAMHTSHKVFREQTYKDELDYKLETVARDLKKRLSQEPQAIERRI